MCCRTLPGGADAQQQGLQAEISRLAPLKEVSSVSSMAPSMNGNSAQQHNPKQPHSLPQGDISDSFFEPFPSQRLDPYFRSGSISSRPSVAGGLSRRASVEGGRTAREGGMRGRLGGAARPTSTPTYVCRAALIGMAMHTSCLPFYYLIAQLLDLREFVSECGSASKLQPGLVRSSLWRLCWECLSVLQTGCQHVGCEHPQQC